MCTELYCPLCNISTFTDIDSFKFNLIKVNSKPIKCPLCAEILLGLDKLTIHLFAHSLQPEEDIKKTAPQNDSSLVSSKPSKKSTISAALGDSTAVEKKPKKSRIKLVKMTSSLASQNETSTKEENFRCEICGFVFVDEQLLNLHLSLVHNFTPKGNNENGIQSLSSSPKRSGSETEGGLVPEGKLWNCHLCGKHFKMKGALRIHIRVAHVRFHDQNQKQINIADYLKSQKSSSIDFCTIKTELLSLQDPYSPPDNTSQYYHAASSPTYASASQSPTHCLTQENALKFSKTFQCEECKKSFTTKYFLKKHKRLHTGMTCKKPLLLSFLIDFHFLLLTSLHELTQLNTIKIFSYDNKIICNYVFFHIFKVRCLINATWRVAEKCFIFNSLITSIFCIIQMLNRKCSFTFIL